MREVFREGRKIVFPESTEAIVNLGDRRIGVIGTNHGDIRSFPGIDQTNQDLERVESLYGPVSALAMDGQGDFVQLVSTLEPPVITSAQASVVLVPFERWAIGHAMKRNIPLIGADPANVISEFSLVIETEQQLTDESTPNIEKEYLPMMGKYPQGSQVGEKISQKEQKTDTLKNQERALRIMQSLDLAVVGAVIALGALKIRTSRRQFLQSVGILGLSLVPQLGSIVERKKIEKDLNALQKVLNNFSPDVLNQFSQDVFTDRNAIEQSGDVPKDLYQSAAFKRQAEYFAQYLPYSLALRNALIAEVLTRPLVDILGESPDQPVSIANIMGSGHLSVKQNQRISYLLQHENERRDAITMLLRSYTHGAQTLLGVPSFSPDYTFSGLLAYPKTYFIKSDGSVTSKPIPIPAVEQIIDTIKNPKY